MMGAFLFIVLAELRLLSCGCACLHEAVSAKAGRTLVLWVILFR